MNTTSDGAREDLAFLRGLVSGEHDGFQRNFGAAYFAAGVCYGAQMLLHAAQGVGWIGGETAGLIIGFAPTLVYVAILIWIIRSRGGAPPTAANRAMAAVFQSVGVASLAMAAVVAAAAWRERSLDVWLIFPCLVMVLQGIAWMVAWQVRRRAWFGAVAGGWIAVGVAMGLTISVLPAYVAICGFGLLAFMLVPGWVLMRRKPD